MGDPWRIRTRLIPGPPGPGVIASGSASWTPGTINGGASVTTVVPVTAAVLGQAAIPGFSLALPAGVLISAAVSSAGNVTVTIVNFGASPVTLGAGTVVAKVVVP